MYTSLTMENEISLRSSCTSTFSPVGLSLMFIVIILRDQNCPESRTMLKPEILIILCTIFMMKERPRNLRLILITLACGLCQDQSVLICYFLAWEKKIFCQKNIPFVVQKSSPLSLLIFISSIFFAFITGNSRLSIFALIQVKNKNYEGFNQLTHRNNILDFCVGWAWVIFNFLTIILGSQSLFFRWKAIDWQLKIYFL